MKTLTKTLAIVAAAGLVSTTAHAGSCSAKADAASAGYGSSKDLVQTAVDAGTFNTLAAALTEADLVGALRGDGPFTVFAPTDEAFAKLPKGTVESLLKPENRDQLVAVLTYHVVEGSVKAGDVVGLDAAETLNGQRVNVTVKGDNVMIDNAKVTATDIQASNGIIHVIDTVLLPESETIVGVAAGNGSFGTLLAAAKAAGLAETLMGEGPFTVFAPTDEAFAKLPAGTVESLLKPENVGQLQNILKYHVVSGRIFSGDVVAADNVRTLSGNDVRVTLKNGTAMLDDAKIVATDIDASNGVIHVIDSVLIPAEKHTAAPSQCGSGVVEI